MKWYVAHIIVALLVATRVVDAQTCTPEHQFCYDERTGGVRTNKAEVMLTPNIGTSITDFEGPLRVMSGHHLIVNGILQSASVLRIIGDLIVSGGARLSIHEMVVLATGSVYLRDDSLLLVTLNAYLGYTHCASVGDEVELRVEASLYDPALEHPVVALRASIGDNESDVSCIEGTFSRVTVGDIADQSGTASVANGESCATNAGSLSAVFNLVSCPSPIPPPPPSRTIITMPPPGNSAIPSTNDSSSTLTPSVEQNTTNAPAGSDSSMLVTIIVAMGLAFVAFGAFIIAAYKVPSLRERLFPFRDRTYDSAIIDTTTHSDETL